MNVNSERGLPGPDPALCRGLGRLFGGLLATPVADLPAEGVARRAGSAAADQIAGLVGNLAGRGAAQNVEDWINEALGSGKDPASAGSSGAVGRSATGTRRCSLSQDTSTTGYTAVRHGARTYQNNDSDYEQAKALTRDRSRAFAQVPADLGTKGGLLTDHVARVLTNDGLVIDGLYAVGNTAAAVMGRTYAGPGATIGPALVFGYLAARHAAGLETR